MSETIKEIFASLNKLEDLQKLVSESEDGESPWLEFKAIKRQSNEKDKEFVRHQKSLLAKEICAFLNTSDGIIAWGIDCNNGTLKIANDYDKSLYDLLDKCIQTIVQPSPKGVGLKTLKTKGGNALLIFVPKAIYSPTAFGVKRRAIIVGIIMLDREQTVYRSMRALYDPYIYQKDAFQEYRFTQSHVSNRIHVFY